MPALQERWLVWGLLILFLLVGTALRLYALDAKSLWYDELGTALYTAPDRSLLDVVQKPLEVPVIPAPPLYFLTTYLFRQVNEHEFLLRLPSVFYGVLAIAATYVLGKALLGPREGLIVAFLLTVAPFNIRYSQEARYYALLMLLATLSLYFIQRGLRRNDRLSWVGYVVSSALALYAHLFAFLFLAVQGLYAIIQFLGKRLLRRGSTMGKEGRSGWRREPFVAFLGSLLAIALLYLPMLPHSLGGLLGRRGLGGRVTPTVSRASLSYLAGIVDLLGAGPGLALVCCLLALALGLLYLGRRARWQLTLAILWILFPFLVVFLVPAGHNFRLRYVIFVLPLFLLVISAGFVGLSWGIAPWVANRLGREKAKGILASLILATCCAVFSVFSLMALQRYWDEEKQPWDKAAAFLQNEVAAQEVVITPNEAHAHRLLYYGYDASEVEYLVPCPCPAPVTREDWLTVAEVASGYEKVWILDPDPNYRLLGPGGSLAEELKGFTFLPSVVFKGHTRDNVVETDLLAPYMTSDVGVLTAVPQDALLGAEQIVELGSLLAGRAEDLFPGKTRYEFTLGELYRAYGSEDEAIAHYEAAIAGDERHLAAYEGLAGIYISRGELAKAVEAYEVLAEKGVIHESYHHYLLANLRLSEGDLEGAIAEFTLAASMDPDDLYYRVRLGDILRAADRLEEAMAQYNEAIRLDPSYAPAYSGVGSIYRAQGRLAEATAEYQKAAELGPLNPFYHALLADAYRQQGLLEEALTEAQEAVGLGSYEAAYYVLVGRIHLEADEVSEAISYFEQGVGMAPGEVLYRLYLADAYHLAGRDEAAVAEYAIILQLDPGNEVATQHLEELR